MVKAFEGVARQGKQDHMNVRSILSTKGSAVETVTGATSLGDAVATLRDRKIGALVVSRDGRYIDGILSERDVVTALAAHGASVLGRSVESAMSRSVVTCSAEDSVESLMESMTVGRFRHMPVVDADDQLCGIVSIGDVVKSRLNALQADNDALMDYLHQGR